MTRQMGIAYCLLPTAPVLSRSSPQSGSNAISPVPLLCLLISNMVTEYYFSPYRRQSFLHSTFSLVSSVPEPSRCHPNAHSSGSHSFWKLHSFKTPHYYSVHAIVTYRIALIHPSTCAGNPYLHVEDNSSPPHRRAEQHQSPTTSRQSLKKLKVETSTSITKPNPGTDLGRTTHTTSR